MNLPDQPPTFRRPTAAERPWSWHLEDATGEAVVPTGDGADQLVDQRFTSQGDAESWVGEFHGALAAAGVDQVVLFEHDRRVYGPMSLHV